MLEAIAIDDEPIALEVIKNLSAKITFIEVKAFFTNAFEAMDYLQQEKIDLIFLDIKMPDISGIDFLKSLTSPPMVIFTTAYSEHAVQSFELDAIDYLLKPFSQSRFLKACNKAFEQFELRNNNSFHPRIMFLLNVVMNKFVWPLTIFYMPRAMEIICSLLQRKKLLSRLTMAETEVLLPSNDFIRVHRSFIVAKKHVTRLDRKVSGYGKQKFL